MSHLIADEEWRKSRKILAPGFSSEMLSKYTEVFNSKSSDLVDSFKRVADTGEVIDVFDYLLKTNIDTIVGKNMSRIPCYKLEFESASSTKNLLVFIAQFRNCQP